MATDGEEKNYSKPKPEPTPAFKQRCSFIQHIAALSQLKQGEKKRTSPNLFNSKIDCYNNFSTPWGWDKSHLLDAKQYKNIDHMAQGETQYKT